MWRDRLLGLDYEETVARGDDIVDGVVCLLVLLLMSTVACQHSKCAGNNHAFPPHHHCFCRSSLRPLLDNSLSKSTAGRRKNLVLCACEVVKATRDVVEVSAILPRHQKIASPI